MSHKSKKGGCRKNSDEILVDESFLSYSDCKIGDKVTFESGTDEAVYGFSDRRYLYNCRNCDTGRIIWIFKQGNRLQLEQEVLTVLHS